MKCTSSSTVTSFLMKLLTQALALALLLQTAEAFPVNCQRWCDKEGSEYRPQDCFKDCKDYLYLISLTKKLEGSIDVLESRYDSLLAITIMLPLLVLLVGIILFCCRNRILTFFNFYICCSSQYKRKIEKKKQIRRNKSANASVSQSGAPQARPKTRNEANHSDGEYYRKKKSSLDRRRSQSLSGKHSATKDNVCTLFSNSKAIGMKELEKKEDLPVNSASTSKIIQRTPESSTPPPSRVRHPSESSCAEASGLNNSSFDHQISFSPNHQGGYYNDALSVSTTSTVPTMPLNASNLLKQSKKFGDSQDSSNGETDASPRSNTHNYSYDSEDLDRYNKNTPSARRTSSPDSVFLSTNILSNSTVDTTLSTMHPS